MARRKQHELVELDGKTLEGGGQLLRIAICLSALTGTPVRIYDIRGARSGGGGLKAQHLACVNWLAHACNATVTGAEKGSKTLLFEPGKVNGLSPAYRKQKLEDVRHVFEARLDIGTAGSTGLALQAILPYILFAPPCFEDNTVSDLPVRLTLSGGTNVSGSPSYEYITQILLPTLSAIGFTGIKAGLGKRGWSHGGSSIGNFTLEIPPRQPSGAALAAFQLGPQKNRGKPAKPQTLKATFIAPASCHEHLRAVMSAAVERWFGSAYSRNNDGLEVLCEDSKHDKRLYLILVATIPAEPDSTQTYKLARDWLYDRKLPRSGGHDRAATEMAERVAYELYQEWESGAWVDEHMRDQMVIFQALAAGRSVTYGGKDEDGELREPSLHARTAEWVARKVLGVKFSEEEGCEGIEFVNGATALHDKSNDPGTEDEPSLAAKFSQVELG